MTATAPADTAASHVPALEVRDLYVTYPARAGRGPARAVDGVDLQLREGEVLALIGESGCGKSTLARALTGLVKPTSGQVLRRGVPLRYTSAAMKAHRKDVQFVLQDPGGALNPRQNVRAAVAEGPRLHGMTDGLDERVCAALSQAGLRPPHEYLSRFPHQMSGGQQQRVVIAGALALEPSVIVADEPVASLDASVRGEILRLLLDLRRDLGLSSLVVSHDLGLAWNIADRVAVMYLGRVVEVGSVEEVLLHPQHPYTKALLSVLPDDGSRSRRPVLLTGEAPDPTEVPAGCRFHPRCPLWAALDKAGRAEAGCDRRTLPTLGGAATADAQVACHLVGRP
ncbi:ABC transporter ATP-binding protein [Streptomyces sp. NPDC058700]|uniref:ABC transporter ATP-binding protein n=1 Tax=unclassified Streptomyces TaxID=2593676 RepID=UPI0036676B1D